MQGVRGSSPLGSIGFQTKKVYNKFSRISKSDPQLTYKIWSKIFKHIYNTAPTKFDINENYVSLGYTI